MDMEQLGGPLIAYPPPRLAETGYKRFFVSYGRQAIKNLHTGVCKSQ